MNHGTGKPLDGCSRPFDSSHQTAQVTASRTRCCTHDVHQTVAHIRHPFVQCQGSLASSTSVVNLRHGHLTQRYAETNISTVTRDLLRSGDTDRCASADEYTRAPRTAREAAVDRARTEPLAGRLGRSTPSACTEKGCGSQRPRRDAGCGTVRRRHPSSSSRGGQRGAVRWTVPGIPTCDFQLPMESDIYYQERDKVSVL